MRLTCGLNCLCLSFQLIVNLLQMLLEIQIQCLSSTETHAQRQIIAKINSDTILILVRNVSLDLNEPYKTCL